MTPSPMPTSQCMSRDATASRPAAGESRTPLGPDAKARVRPRGPCDRRSPRRLPCVVQLRGGPHGDAPMLPGEVRWRSPPGTLASPPRGPVPESWAPRVTRCGPRRSRPGDARASAAQDGTLAEKGVDGPPVGESPPHVRVHQGGAGPGAVAVIALMPGVPAGRPDGTLPPPPGQSGARRVHHPRPEAPQGSGARERPSPRATPHPTSRFQSSLGARPAPVPPGG